MERREGSEILTLNEITHLLFLFTACFNHQELSVFLSAPFKWKIILIGLLPHIFLLIIPSQ